MKSCLYLLVVLLMAARGSEAFAADWWFVPSENKGENLSMVYIDKSSLERVSQSNRITAWVWMIFRNDQTSEFGNYRSDKHRLTVDCEKQEAGVDSGFLYSAYGKLIQQYRKPAPEMAPIGPATLRETVARFFCTGGKQPARTLPVYDPNRDAEQRFLLREREVKPAETVSPDKGVD